MEEFHQALVHFDTSALGLEDRRGELCYDGGLMLGLGLEGFGIYLEDQLLVRTLLSLEEVATFWRLVLDALAFACQEELNVGVGSLADAFGGLGGFCFG